MVFSCACIAIVFSFLFITLCSSFPYFQFRIGFIHHPYNIFATNVIPFIS